MPPPEAITGKIEAPGGELIKVPPLSDEEKLTVVRWVDLGCPIDLGDHAKNRNRRGQGWLLDEGRPTLTLTYPRPGVTAEPLTRILIGMHDYYTGLDTESFTVTADFEIDGVPPGRNLATRFRPLTDHRWEWKLAKQITVLDRGTLTVSIRDREGNVNWVECSFKVRVPAP